jgi:hypothetical protein
VIVERLEKPKQEAQFSCPFFLKKGYMKSCILIKKQKENCASLEEP